MNAFLSLVISANLFAATLPNNILDTYHNVQHALATDELANGQSEAVTLGSSISDFLNAETTTVVEKNSAQRLLEGCTLMKAATEEAGIRKGFELVSQGLVELIRLRPESQKGQQLFYCPMAPGYRYWVQPSTESILNPYFGKKMQKCGSKKPW